MHDYYFVKNNFVERIVPIGILRFLQRIRPKTSTNYSLERIDDVDISIQDSLERHIKRISFEISNKQTIELIEITDKNGIQLNLKNQGNLQKFEQIKGAENSETIQSKLIGTWIFSKELTRSFLKDEKTLEQCCLRAQDENKLIFSKNGELAIEGRSRTFKLKYKISRISKKDILNLKILTERYDVLDKRYKMSESGLEYYPNTNEGLVFIYQKE